MLTAPSSLSFSTLGFGGKKTSPFRIKLPHGADESGHIHCIVGFISWLVTDACFYESFLKKEFITTGPDSDRGPGAAVRGASALGLWGQTPPPFMFLFY